MTKTQKELISRLVNRHCNGSMKVGWSLNRMNNVHTNQEIVFLRLQKPNEINQALKLSDQYPEIFGAHAIGFRCIDLLLMDDLKARDLIK